MNTWFGFDTGLFKNLKKLIGKVNICSAGYFINVLKTSLNIRGL